ncbi:MAG: hypothetical protein PF442_05905 [Desulfobulbaceae bacterium]|jgi:hypothetical protein|nr:hypothetical protein [Desulfobulbaceae bacterium]
MNKSTAASFPWAGTHPWDVDILVIGGGPAGLAAVTRLRWMKSCSPTPLSVVLVNSGPIGGLARLGNSILTGPALAFPAGELVRRLEQDLETYPAPVLDQKVVEIRKTKDLFTTTMEDGSVITSVSVILTCGMLDLRNIHQFWQKGVTATFGNRANIRAILKRELTAHRNPVILGGPHLLQLLQTIQNLNLDTRLLIQGSGHHNQGNTIYGELVRIEPSGQGLTLHLGSGAPPLETDRLILEFNSLELHRSPLPLGLDMDGIGYLAPNATPGLYHGGDCGGPPFSAVVALGEGAKAGLEAYRYTHQFKYNRPAPLFAYYGDDSVTDENIDQDDFHLHPDLIPARLLDRCPSARVQELWDVLDGATSIKDLESKGVGDNVQIHDQILTLLEKRAITFCPQRDRI